MGISVRLVETSRGDRGASDRRDFTGLSGSRSLSVLPPTRTERERERKSRQINMSYSNNSVVVNDNQMITAPKNKTRVFLKTF